MKSTIILTLFILFSQTTLAYVPISEEKLAELVESFNYVPDVKYLKKPKTSCAAQDFSYSVTYPQRKEPLLIKGKSFIPAVSSGQPKVPVIFLLPPMGGTNSLDTGAGRKFCENNLATFIISSNLTGLDSETLVPVTDHDQTHRRVAAALKGGMLLVKTHGEINPEKIGLFGASLGGILGSVAYSVIPEISAVTFLVNGADVPHILANSTQSEIVKLKKARKKEQGFKTDADYEAYLNKHLEIDPLHFVKMIDPNTVRLYLSKSDDMVPTVDQMRYYEALGSPKEVKFYNSGHVSTIVSVMGLSGELQKTADWFRQRFAMRNPRISEYRLAEK
jgi:hypothetical protein